MRIPVLAGLVFAASLAAAMEPDGSVLLPVQQRAVVPPRADVQSALAAAPAWRAFREQHRGWTAYWNEVTGTPQRAVGPALRLRTSGPVTEATVQSTADAAVRELAGVLIADPARLRLTRAVRAGRVWYVSYVQVHGGLDVLLSEVELRFSPEGNVIGFGSVIYPHLGVSTVPALTPATAAARAAEGLTGMTVRTDGRLRILPVSDGERFTDHLVYEVSVERSLPPAHFVTFVDAHTGVILWRHNRARSTGVTGVVRGDVQLTLPTDPFVSRPFSAQEVLLGSDTLTTDSTGAFGTVLTGPADLLARLAGPHVAVQRVDAPDALISRTVMPGDSVSIVWTDANSHPAERDAFYHTNIIHEYITGLDPAFTAISYRMPCVVNINLTCNAFWNGSGINFFAAGGGCPNTAQMPDVVYHEYGHGINDKLYEQLGAPFGMINGATHEGLADVAAAVLTDDPRIGMGFFGPGTFLRSIQNTLRYPQNASSSPHSTGLILAGALWDLRQSVSREVFQRLSHFAKYGLPDDPNDGAAFAEWFIETLIADDDDGNLANGTPHSQAITTAFDAHGIGSALYFGRSFAHTPVASSPDTTRVFVAEWTLEGIPGVAPDSMRLVYSTDGFASAAVVPASPTGGAGWEAEIPAQGPGTVVAYYISAFDPVGRTSYRFPADAPAASYRFLVGRQPAVAGLLYAVSGAHPVLFTLTPQAPAAVSVGELGVNLVHNISVRPSTRELYAVWGGPATTRLLRISPALGLSFDDAVIPRHNIRAFAFLGGDTLMAGDGNGQLYRILLDSLRVDSVGPPTGVPYAGLAVHPQEGSLWASVRPLRGTRDALYRVDRNTGAASFVGRTGDGLPTWALAFSADGRLFALKGQGTQENRIELIDQTTGAGALVGMTGVTGLAGIAMRGDSAGVTGVDGEPGGVPRVFSLSESWPNPFNPSTRLRVEVPSTAHVRITVFDLLGRVVARLADGVLRSGSHVVEFSAAGLSSGVYFARMEAIPLDGGESVSAVRRMMLIR